MSTYIVPTIGTSGVFQLKAPFDTDLTAGVAYFCLSIRTLSDILGEGKDPLAAYYTPKGLSEEKYLADLSDGVSIVGLQSGSGDWVYVPSSYVASYPNGSGVPYTAMMIAVSLGAVPDELNLSALQQAIIETCQDVSGLIAVTRAVAVSKTQLIDDAKHETLETIRINRSTTDASSAVHIANLENQLQLATAKITNLENFIVQRGLIEAMSTSLSISLSTSQSISTQLSLSTSVSNSLSLSQSVSASQSLSSSLSTG